MTTKISPEQLKEYVLLQFKSLENILKILHDERLAQVIEYIAYDFRRGNTDCILPDNLEDDIPKSKN